MKVLLRIAPQEAWQALALVIGFAQFGFMLLNHRPMRWVMAGVAAWFWGSMAFGVWVATPWNPAAVAYAGWCGLNAFSIIRLMRPDNVP